MEKYETVKDIIESRDRYRAALEKIAANNIEWGARDIARRALKRSSDADIEHERFTLDELEIERK